MRPQDTSIVLPRDFEGLFAGDFRAALKIPPRIPLSVVTGWQPCDSAGSRCVGGVLTLGATGYALAHNDGTLSDIGMVDVSLTPAMTTSFRSALTALSKQHLIPPVGDRDSVSIVIEISAEDHPDTVAAERKLFTSILPHYDAPFSYARMPSTGIHAQYPIRAGLAGIGDSVEVAFTVDADGTIAAESIDLVNANYREFVRSVVEALFEAKYHPAHLGDCAVATRMRQRFMFKAAR